MKPRLARLCFVSLYSYPLFHPECESPFGGSEVRVSLIARELARTSRFEVTVVVFDHDQPRVEWREGVRLHRWTGRPCPLRARAGVEPAPAPAPAPARGGWGTRAVSLARTAGEALKRVPGLRGVLGHGYHRWSDVSRQLSRMVNWVKRRRGAFAHAVGHIGPYPVDRAAVAVYDEVEADIYVLPGNSTLAAELAWYCQSRDKKYVFLAGSDGDYHPGYKAHPWQIGLYGAPGYLMAYAIQQAHAHIVQTRQQAEQLRQIYGRQATIISNPIDLALAYPRQADPQSILWIGKSDPIKRPEILLALARRLPGYAFVMIMTLSDQDIFNRCTAMAHDLPNVTLLDYTPFRDVELSFTSARVLVNTSTFEGFPNTFLQAAKYGVPVISYQVDPGRMLSEHGCGACCHGNFEDLVEQVQQMMATPARHADAAARSLAYVRTHHDKNKIIPSYEGALLALLDGAEPPRSAQGRAPAAD